MQRCGEESYLGVALRDGARRRYTVALDASSSLLVGGCLGGDAPRGAVEIAVQGVDGRSEEHRIDLGRGWHTTRVALHLPAGKAHVTLTAAARPGGSARLRDLAVETVGRVAPLAPAKRVILISLDTFREDAIGAIGGRTRTPTLDALLGESERFFPHWAADISTKSSHASMLSGLPVAVHGCDRGKRPLPPDVATLAERLQAVRIETAGFLSVAPFFQPRFGLAQGFATWRLAAWSSAQELRAASNWVASHRDLPFFLFVHLYATHSDADRLPYESPGMTADTVARRFGVADYGCRGGVCASRFLSLLNAGLLPRDNQDAEILHFLYDRGVESLDGDLGTFFDDLRRDGVWDDSLLILTADHGEQFGEHGVFLHTTAHEETLRVPLLVKWPAGRAAGRATERPSSSLDLMPTVLTHFGLPRTDLSGSDLAQPSAAPPVVIAADAVRSGGLKLLLATPEFPEALYDLAHDPAEQHNLLAERSPEARRLLAAHARALAAARRRLGRVLPTAPQPYTAEELEQLRALGYLR